MGHPWKTNNQVGKDFNCHWKFTAHYTKVVLVGSVGAAEEVDGNP